MKYKVSQFKIQNSKLAALAAIAAVLLLAGCSKKDGVFEPEQKVQYRYDTEYTQWMVWLQGEYDTTLSATKRHLAEAYTWSDDLLTAISYYDTSRRTNTLLYTLDFLYEKKQVQKAVDSRYGNYSVFVYDEDKGKWLEKIETFSLLDDSPVATLTFTRPEEKSPYFSKLEYRYYPVASKITPSPQGYTLTIDLQWSGTDITTATYTYTPDDGKALTQTLTLTYDDHPNPLHKCAQHLLAPRDIEYGRHLYHLWQNIAALSEHNVTKAVCDFTEEYYATSGDLATRDIHHEWTYTYAYAAGEVQVPTRVVSTWVDNEYSGARLTYQEKHERTSEYFYLPEE